MSTTNSPSTMIGDFKDLYKSSGLVDAVPSWFIIQDRFPFEVAEAGLGQYFIFGVVLQKEQGFTYAPSSGSNSGPQTLNAAVSAYIGRAQVEGYAIYLRSRLSYDAAAKASAAGKKAFAQAYGMVLKNMKESHQFRLEHSLLYGRDGLGQILSNTGGALVITSATWSNALFASGMKDAVLEAFDGTGATVTQHDADLTISSVDPSTRTVTVTGTSTSVVANDWLYFKSARTATVYKECVGLRTILNTSSGTIFNIDSSSYELWRGQQFAVNGNLSLTAIMNGAAKGLVYGLRDGLFLCNETKFAQLASDEAALRRYIQDQPNAKRGVKGIVFQLGSVDVEIVAHPLIRQGEAMLLAKSELHRCGASDVTFGMPGSDEKMQVHVTDTTALELRSLSDQGMFSYQPSQNVLFTGIT